MEAHPDPARQASLAEPGGVTVTTRTRRRHRQPLDAFRGLRPGISENLSFDSLCDRFLDQIFGAPWTAIVPGLMIFLTVLGINDIGDNLREAFDPRKIL